jgi:rRNA pseudouridine-1189 N-methylase Emg1 (Nep1/Mra1 family)
MQALFQYLQTINKISSDDEQLIQLISNSLGEQLVDDPVTVQLPMTGKGGE